MPKLEWNEAKDRSNQKRHGISFREASRLFESGERYLEIFDVEHSEFEDRSIAIGMIDRGVVVVVYTEREDDVIRIIGARFATTRERNRYLRHMDYTDERHP